MIKIFATDKDEVIQSTVAVGRTNYKFALKEFLPLLDRFGEQRKIQSKSFYARLKSDIISGCIMPPITLAFVDSQLSSGAKIKDVETFIRKNISEGYILDGLQRLNTLKEASEEEGFDENRAFHVNVIIAKKYDLLLYRMITLNNGQKPMTARHQIEMLTKGAIDLSGFDLPIATEKDTEKKVTHGAFRRSDIVEAYTAYLTNNVNNQNKKIIEAKLDEILVGRVMESNLRDADFSYSEILAAVERYCANPEAKTWLRQVNNLIGFTVGAKRSLEFLRKLSEDDFADQVAKFEKAFDAINPSKVNVGKFRRELSAYFIGGLEEFFDSDVSDIEAAFFDETLSE